MTSIRDYCDSIRTSLSLIEEAADPDREPHAEFGRLFRNLDTLADDLATKVIRDPEHGQEPKA